MNIEAVADLPTLDVYVRMRHLWGYTMSCTIRPWPHCDFKREFSPYTDPVAVLGDVATEVHKNTGVRPQVMVISSYLMAYITMHPAWARLCRDYGAGYRWTIDSHRALGQLIQVPTVVPVDDA